MVRLRDKVAAIRVQAVYSLARLQDPDADDCPVIDALVKALGSDNSMSVPPCSCSCSPSLTCLGVPLTLAFMGTGMSAKPCWMHW